MKFFWSGAARAIASAAACAPDTILAQPRAWLARTPCPKAEENTMQRRDFLKRAGCFAVSASVFPWLGCSSDDAAAKPQTSGTSYMFAQGVASGDPQPDSIVLWTRAVGSAADATIPLLLEVSTSEDFATLVVSKMVSAGPASDHTVRVFVDGLDSNTIYFYRFSAADTKSRVGRTRTAPNLDADVEPRFAWVCCQDYVANFFSAYRRMINDDMAADESEQLHFVMHIGDFIYETRGADFMHAIDDNLEPVALTLANGDPRNVPEFPDGGTNSGGIKFANTLADYRQLYAAYLSDPDLQDARARWPFIAVWDDHEFTDDCWQTQANYDRAKTTDEPSQKRRVAASQAWFEYIPSALSDLKAPGEIAQAAKDFVFVAVEDAPYDQVIEVDEPNNVKAISAITIYRNFRFGQHLELVLTDNRAYRSDQAIPEDATATGQPFIFDPRVALPKDAVEAMDAGSEANGGAADSVEGIPNLRKDSAPGSLLGATQKGWWKDVMQASSATFKVWGNTVPLLRFLLDRSAVPLLPYDLLLSDDAWDGYNTERKELMSFLKDQDIKNVVSLSGDHHAHFAGLVAVDYDADPQEPVMVDFVTAGISSNSQWAAVAAAVKGGIAGSVPAVAQLIYYEATDPDGNQNTVVNLNTLILWGSHAATVAAETNDPAQIKAARDTTINPHLRHVDCHAYGYGLAHVTADGLNTTLVSIVRDFEDRGTDSPDLRYQAKFSVPRVDQFSDLKLEPPELIGTKPWPLS
jgi:alkaline phosphatase D